ncbi:Protein CBG24490 [Caenorhabditis briggsae]|uniref:Protein CBG24490 n=1 Tax=Caenorhabditis briggsae TaxID=6238 RepID=A8WKT8_CAEBR|nr:Protein CBG24490 [Caenorhabditis briggsae]CAP21083.2 Protein CBG24490 [Caenorhabditis briggsae]
MMSAEETMKALRELAPEDYNMTQYLTTNAETSQPLPFEVDDGFAEYTRANCYDKRRSVVKNFVQEVEIDELKQRISAHGEMIENINSDPELNSNHRFYAFFDDGKTRQICRVLEQRTVISQGRKTSFEPIHFTSTDIHFYQHMGFACSELCGCEGKCTNSVLMIPNKRLFPIEMFRSNEKLGFGVRSSVLIPAGTPVTEFVGEIIGEQIDIENTNWNNIEYAYQVTYVKDDVLKQLVDQTNFSKNYKGLLKDLYANISYYLDPTVCGNYARMASHSCAANMDLVRIFQKSLSPAHIHLVMVAVTDIFPGTPYSKTF